MIHPYDLGYSAYYLGGIYNPYPYWSICHFYFEQGWMDACDDEIDDWYSLY